MAIYVGGAGAAIIGGLYWEEGGPTAGRMDRDDRGGPSLSVGGMLAQHNVRNFPRSTGTQISFGVSLLCVLAYVLVSLLTCREDFNMDRLLHRGRYAIAGDQAPRSTRQHRRAMEPWFDDRLQPRVSPSATS